MSETCENCHFSLDIDSKTTVMCRRYPPQTFKADAESITCYFPYVNAKSWCGEYRERYGSMAKTLNHIQPSTEKPQ